MNDRSIDLIFDRALIAEQDYWLSVLTAPVEVPVMRLDYRRPGIYSGQKKTYPLTLDTEISRQLGQIGGSSPFLLYTTLMAAFAVLLDKYTNAGRLLVGSPARRQTDDANQQPNVLVIMVDIGDGTTFRELLVQVRQTLLNAYSRQNYPYERLINELGVEKVKNKCPLLDSVLMLEGFHTLVPEINNDLTVTFNRTAETITGSIEFNSQLFKQSTIAQLASNYYRTLSTALADLDTPVRQLSLLSGPERSHLLAQWMGNNEDFQTGPCLHELFENQVERNPEAIAVIYEQERITYGELNCRANRVANYLREMGARPEAMVGLCIGRSIDLIVGL